MKKLLLSLGALAAVVAPVASVIACGTSNSDGSVFHPEDNSAADATFNTAVETFTTAHAGAKVLVKGNTLTVKGETTYATDASDEAFDDSAVKVAFVAVIDASEGKVTSLTMAGHAVTEESFYESTLPGITALANASKTWTDAKAAETSATTDTTTTDTTTTDTTTTDTTNKGGDQATAKTLDEIKADATKKILDLNLASDESKYTDMVTAATDEAGVTDALTQAQTAKTAETAAAAKITSAQTVIDLAKQSLDGKTTTSLLEDAFKAAEVTDEEERAAFSTLGIDAGGDFAHVTVTITKVAGSADFTYSIAHPDIASPTTGTITVTNFAHAQLSDEDTLKEANALLAKMKDGTIDCAYDATDKSFKNASAYHQAIMTIPGLENLQMGLAGADGSSFNDKNPTIDPSLTEIAKMAAAFAAGETALPGSTVTLPDGKVMTYDGDAFTIA